MQTCVILLGNLFFLLCKRELRVNRFVSGIWVVWVKRMQTRKYRHIWSY